MPALLLTRPEDQSERFARQLGDAGPVVISPLLRIEPLSPDLPSARTLVLTSLRGAEAAARLNVPQGTPALCVGEATAEAARLAGLDARAAAGDAEALYYEILSLQPPTPLLHLRGRHARGDLARRLTEAGLPTEERIVYEQTPLPLSEEARRLLAGAEPVVVPLFSPRTAELLAAEGPFAAPLLVVAMSPAVAEAVVSLHPAQCRVAPHPSASDMLALTREVLERGRGSHASA
ncbi:uroporphyrinogen-III synthase [Histidinibacterium aquaticum]|nr:uroporphyrinogen-III synthase [Histidinibacterium aquaticum]